MNITKFLAAALAMLCGLTLSAQLPVSAEESEPALVDSGIDYTESVGTIRTPGAGYTSPLAFRCKPGETKAYNPTGDLVVMFVDIGGFSSGSNGTTDSDGNYTEGTDYDLDDVFFSSMRQTLENSRRNGCMVGIRFRYDANGVRNPEPATFDQMVRHIEQIRADGFLEDYKDIICYVESGFVGCYGEQWGGKYCSLEDKAKLLDLMLDVVPDSIPVTVRTPNIFAKWAGIEESDLGDYVLEAGSQAARVGLYNDGYMGSDSDLGTFHDRTRDLKWLRQQTLTSYYGGEFSGNLDFAKKYDTYLPENAVPEMYYSHLSYINSNIYSLYKDYTFGEAYDVEGVDNSAYYGQTVFQFIRDHLGYRFVLRDSDLSGTVSQDGVLRIAAKVENTGFANPIPEQKAEIILEKDGNYLKTEVDADTRTWYSCTTVSPEFDLKLPAAMETGEWKVYLKLSAGDNELGQMSFRSVQFANSGIWNASLGANYLGSFTVTADDSDVKSADNSFYQTNAAQEVSHSDGTMYTAKNLVTVDGAASSDTEYTDEMVCTRDENGNYLSITNDDQYLYIFADLKQDAQTPVYNLSFQNVTTGKSYWMYYQNNGFVYFNGTGGVPLGCVQKHSGNTIEFRLPLGDFLGMSAGTELADIAYTVQDQANSWNKTGSLKASSYTVTDNFNVYSAKQTVNLAEGDTMELAPLTSGSGLSYQWYHDGEQIENATEKSYAITADSKDTCGIYSVTVTTPSGIAKTVEVCEVADVILQPVQPVSGDINQDGTVDLADVILLQKYLLAQASLTQEQTQLADLQSDDTVNGFDLALLRTSCLSAES